MASLLTVASGFIGIGMTKTVTSADVLKRPFALSGSMMQVATSFGRANGFQMRLDRQLGGAPGEAPPKHPAAGSRLYLFQVHEQASKELYAQR